ncbi:hypothetical protein TELCIR_02674 [Teladorsagia circumcincta]|uniref:tRNA (adenine(58)-N(1))-methyltransferase non-catalytic subunit TRM6 n=1 Tax=Teladorsagia circumcincta TaxID=45464 RepID=A0A2G9UYF0_TELCI|nr:hypothetical protein TELCIR_02674 [Teladorsagia circumcincta]
MDSNPVLALTQFFLLFCSVFGQPYGLFEVSSGQATPVCASQVVQDEGVGDIELRDVNGSGSADSTESTVPEEFNIELNPAQALQRLSQEEVLNLKDQGITAGELIFSTFLPVRITSILGTTNQQENEEKEEVVQDNVEAAEDSSAIRRADRLAREQRGLSLLAGGVDALIIATRTVDPVSILEVTFPRLRPSGSVVVYGPHMEVC